MLVSVALVLLIMTLFAQAFGIAAGSIKKQRGLAENDQRARSMVTIILGDLQKRTFRQRLDTITQPVNLPVDVDENDPSNPRDAFNVQMKRLEDRANRLGLGLVPLHPDYFNGGAPTSLAAIPTSPSSAGNPGPSFRPVDDVRERGYFYISEGDPSHDGDDVLKFTINMANTELGNLNTSRLTGRSVMLLPTWNNQGDTNPANDVELNEDQPIWDDGIGWVENALTGVRRSFLPDEPGTTASRYAEVAIFIRDGNLYMRKNLIREPLEHMDDADIGDGQPSLDVDGTGADVFGPGVDYTSDSFWNDFDHGATRSESTAGDQIHFNDVASLDNTVAGDVTLLGPDTPPGNRFWSLGDPRNRFGFDNTFRPVGANELQGRPKEYMDPTNPLTFIGAYTHAETSDPNFLYPGQRTYAGGMDSPMRWGSLPPVSATSDNNADGRIDLLDDFQVQQPREGEDLLLANCHAFDVKVWDDVLGRFVDLGHATTDGGGAPSGDMHLRAITDTGFPLALDPADPATTNTTGRYQAARHGMGRYGGLASTTNRVFDTWHPAFNFTNDIRLNPGPPPTPINRPDNDPPPYRPLWTDREDFDAGFNAGGSGGLRPRFWVPGADYNVGNRVFPWPNFAEGPGLAPSPSHMSFYYVCVEAIDGDGDGDVTSSMTDQPNWPEAPGARIEDGEGADRLVWKAINNTIGLKAIQITMRFFDPTSGQMRQLTITHSFVEL